MPLLRFLKFKLNFFRFHLQSLIPVCSNKTPVLKHICIHRLQLVMKTVIFEILISIVFTNKHYFKIHAIIHSKISGGIYSSETDLFRRHFFSFNPSLVPFFDSVLPRKKYTFPIYKWCKYEFSVKWGWNIYKILDSPEILIVFSLLDMFYDVQ